jgi:hypothetical protein
VVGAVEFVCGLFLALGFLTRVVAAPIIGGGPWSIDALIGREL